MSNFKEKRDRRLSRFRSKSPPSADSIAAPQNVSKPVFGGGFASFGASSIKKTPEIMDLTVSPGAAEKSTKSSYFTGSFGTLFRGSPTASSSFSSGGHNFRDVMNPHAFSPTMSYPTASYSPASSSPSPSLHGYALPSGYSHPSGGLIGASYAPPTLPLYPPPQVLPPYTQVPTSTASYGSNNLPKTTRDSAYTFNSEKGDAKYAAQLQSIYDEEYLEADLHHSMLRTTAHPSYVIGERTSKAAHTPIVSQTSSGYSQDTSLTQCLPSAVNSTHVMLRKDNKRQVQVGLQKPKEQDPSPPIPEPEVEAEVDPALHQFGQQILKVNCAHCKKHLVYGEKDMIKLTKRWLGGQAPVDSVLVCGKCSKSTCVGCGSLRNSYQAPSRIPRSPKAIKSPDTSPDYPPVWCCDDGRLFLIWALLCVSDHQKGCNDRRDSYFTRSRAASDPPKPSKPVRKSNGTGYGDNLGFAGGSDFISHFDDEFGYMPMPAIVKRRPFPTGAMSKKPKENGDSVLEPALRNLAALLPKLECSLPFDQDPPSVLVSMLKRSPILEKAAELLRNESLDDVTARRALYQRLFDFIQSLASHPVTAAAVFQERIVYPHDLGLLSMSFGERKYDLRGKGKSKAETAQPLASVITNLRIASRKMLKGSKSRMDDFQSSEGGNLLALCSRVCDLSDFLLANCLPQDNNGDCKGKGKAPMNYEKTIEQWHREHCVDEIPDELLNENFYFSRLSAEIEGMPTKKGRMKHLMTELATLQTALPEGIYVRHGASRLDVMKVMISGPKDTPYEGGLFEFDLFCPLNYPNEAPKMQFKTTGGGAAHFNPNLYADGKGKLPLRFLPS
jgi:hypothetical protein